MAIKIKLKNSVTQDAVPTGTHLPEVGELAVNANINSIGGYMRASDNSIVKIFGPGSVSTPAASTTASGIAELATSAETTTGTDTARVCTPAGVKAVTDAERTTSNSTYLALSGGTLVGVLQATAGSNSAPAIHFGDSDSGIYGGTNTVSLAAGGTQGLSLNSSAYVNVPTRLGIGVAAPAVPLHVIGEARIDPASGTSTIRFSVGGTEKGKLAVDSSSNLFFETAGTERARIDASGRLLVGLASARTLNSGYTPPLQVEGNTATTSSISAINNINQTGGPSVWLGKSRGAALGGVTTVQSGDELGSIFFNGADGTDIQSIGASIVAKSNGTVAGNRMPGELLFATTADSAGSVAPTTRLTIDSAGAVNVPDNGKFTAGASDDLSIYHDSNHTYIDNHTGQLKIRNAAAGDILIQARDDDEGIIVKPDGAVELYYDHSKKFQTYDDGIKVTNRIVGEGGDLRLSSGAATGDIQFQINGSTVMTVQDTSKLEVNDDFEIVLGNGSDLKIYHSAGAASHINATGLLNIDGTTGVRLEFDNATKFETLTDGAKVTGDLTVTTGNSILTNSSQGQLTVKAGATYPGGAIKLAGGQSGTTDRGTIIFYSGEATSLEPRMYIDSAGEVGIGTSTPTGIHNLAKVLEISGGDGGDLIIGNSVSTNVGAGAHIGSIAFKNIDSAGSQPHYAGIRCEAVDTAGNMDLRFYTGSADLEADNYGVRLTGRTYYGYNSNGYITKQDNYDTDGGKSYWYDGGSGNNVVQASIDGTTGNITSKGNFVVGTAGKGIDFSAQTASSATNATTDNELLDHFERGSWTPTDGSSGGLTLSVGSASYVRIGNLVFINFYVTYPSNTDTALNNVSGLPFAAKGSGNYSYLTGRISGITNNVAVQVNAGASYMHIYVGDSGYSNTQLSSKYVLVSGCYSVI